MPHLIALTGGPGGGKTTLLDALARDPAWQGRFLALPEAIFVAGRIGIAPQEQRFQRLMVEVQWALEDAVRRTLEPDAPRCILCHRGSLDPLAYWLDRGWPEADFFTFTGATRAEHYRRYAAIIHLVTAADGAEAHYRRWPAAHRPETATEALTLDRLLEDVWSAHPHYHRIDNASRDWTAKFTAAQSLLAQYCWSS